MLVLCGNVVLNTEDIKLAKVVKLKDGKYVIGVYLNSTDESHDDFIYCTKPSENEKVVHEKFKEFIRRIDNGVK